MITSNEVFKGLPVSVCYNVGQISLSSDHLTVTFTALKSFNDSKESFDSEAFSFGYCEDIDIIQQCNDEMKRIINERLLK